MRHLVNYSQSIVADITYHGEKMKAVAGLTLQHDFRNSTENMFPANISK